MQILVTVWEGWGCHQPGIALLCPGKLPSISGLIMLFPLSKETVQLSVFFCEPVYLQLVCLRTCFLDYCRGRWSITSFPAHCLTSQEIPKSAPCQHRVQVHQCLSGKLSFQITGFWSSGILSSGDLLNTSLPWASDDQNGPLVSSALYQVWPFQMGIHAATCTVLLTSSLKIYMFRIMTVEVRLSLQLLWSPSLSLVCSERKNTQFAFLGDKGWGRQWELPEEQRIGWTQLLTLCYLDACTQPP